MLNKIKQLLSKFFQAFSTTGIPAIIGLLGAIAGQKFKWFRRFLIPVIFTVCAVIETKSLWSISTMIMVGWLSLGYGESSFLYKLCKGKNWTVRGTIGVLISLSFLVIPILKGNWFIYLLGSLGIILTWAFITWQGLGSFKVKLFGKEYDCLKVDFLSYSVLGICGMFIIFK